MDPSHKHCDCQFCPECQDSIPEDLQPWLHQQLDPKELDEPKSESEEAEEPGSPDAALLVTEASASADQMGASALGFRPGGSKSSDSTDRSPKTDTSDTGFVQETPNSLVPMTNTPQGLSPMQLWLLRQAHPNCPALQELRP
ncbi:hypothetical protein MTO96_037467 [Rhipicephalus appendiculatus]